MALESCAVPLRGVGGGGVGAFEKLHEGGVGRRFGAEGVVFEDELA